MGFLTSHFWEFLELLEDEPIIHKITLNTRDWTLEVLFLLKPMNQKIIRNWSYKKNSYLNLTFNILINLKII